MRSGHPLPALCVCMRFPLFEVQICPCAEAVDVHGRYAELLKEIRMGRVRKVMYFDNDESAVNVEEYQEVEGPCLVVFNDNQVAHSYVPRFVYRIP